MWQMIGWISWGIIGFLALSFAWGCRSYVKAGHGFQQATGVQTFFWWFIFILFLIFGWNKLHILWIAPIAFFSAQYLALGNIPILSSAVLFLTKIFFHIILVGIDKPAGLSSTSSDFKKIAFIKSLVKKRIQNDSVMSMIGNIDALSDTMLMGLPEATIVTIVETYFQLKKQGRSDTESLNEIESHRASFGDSGILPSELTLSNYIKYRVGLEHSHGTSITDEFVEEAIKETIDAIS